MTINLDYVIHHENRVESIKKNLFASPPDYSPRDKMSWADWLWKRWGQRNDPSMPDRLQRSISASWSWLFTTDKNLFVKSQWSCPPCQIRTAYFGIYKLDKMWTTKCLLWDLSWSLLLGIHLLGLTRQHLKNAGIPLSSVGDTRRLSELTFIHPLWTEKCRPLF